jgi:hypothetical protein
MKTIIKIVLVMLIAVPFSSCEDSTDLYQKWLEGGEIIYAPKVENIETFAGENRVLLRVWLLNSPNVKELSIYWNDGQDSLRVPVTLSAGLDSVDVFIPELTEKAYTFDVSTIDTYGHHSLKTSGFATSYGDEFKNLLTNRLVSDMQVQGADGKITWVAAPEYLFCNDIRYTDINDDEKTVRVLPDQTTTTLPGLKLGTPCFYRSLFLPEANAVDTFALGTEWIKIPYFFEIGKSGWSLVAASGSDGENFPENVFDGNVGTVWQTSWRAPATPPPHWLIIDMGASFNINRMLTRKFASAQTVQYFISDTPTYNGDPDTDSNWTKITEIVFPNGSPNNTEISSFVIPGVDAQGQYLLLYLPDPGYAGQYISIAEITAFEKVE